MNAAPTKQKPRIWVVHGIHTNDRSDGWMDFLTEAFNAAGWDARKWSYGYAYAMLTRLQNPGRASKLCDLIEPGDTLLTHSNGGCLAWMASLLGAPFTGWISIAPALDADKVAAPQVRWVNLYANHYDDAVKIARIFPAHPWGAQGRDGLSVEDHRYRTTFTDSAFNNLPRVIGHSGMLSAENLPAWSVRLVADAIIAAHQ